MRPAGLSHYSTQVEGLEENRSRIATIRFRAKPRPLGIIQAVYSISYAETNSSKPTIPPSRLAETETPLKYNPLADSDLLVSEVCLGTMTWGEQNTESEAHEQLDYAVSKGINFIDTAEMYPVPADPSTQGATEAVLGSWLKKQKRENLIVASKVAAKSGMTWIRDGSALDRGNIRQAVEDSLKRLRTEYIDLYQVHWPDRWTPRFGEYRFNEKAYHPGTAILETMQALNELVEEGKIRYYGVSNETPWGISQYMSLAEKHGLPKPITIQNAYNLLNRHFDRDLAESCFHEGIDLLAYSPLAFGLLTGKYLNGARPHGARLTKFPGYARRYTDKTNADQAVKALAELVGVENMTKVALQFCKSRFFCKSTIIGATNVRQLSENIAAFSEDIHPELLKAIEEIHLKYPSPCP